LVDLLVTFIACEIVTGRGLTEILGSHPGRFCGTAAAARRAASSPLPCYSAAIPGGAVCAGWFLNCSTRSNFEPVMRSVRDLKKLDGGRRTISAFRIYSLKGRFWRAGKSQSTQQDV
jgi:hypothetical protein